MDPSELQLVAQELYELVGPLQFAEPENAYAMAILIQAICLADEEPYYFSEDISALVDIDRTPTKALPWLGQFFGVPPKPDLDDPEQRDRIRETDGWNRGTRDSIIGAAKQYLTGAKRVSITERDTGAYHFRITTYTPDTPDEAAVAAAIDEATPGGLQYLYQVMPGQTFRDLRDGYATFRAARTAFPTFRGMRNNIPGA
jgi:hypothetical protein